MDEVRIELEGKRTNFYSNERFSDACDSFIHQFRSRCKGRGSRRTMNLEFAVLWVFLIKNKDAMVEMDEFKPLLNNLAIEFFDATADTDWYTFSAEN